jgi:hypothetical protein
MKRPARIVSRIALVALAGAAYVAYPFWSAWSLREAIKNGDTATIERSVEWERVRTTLRESLSRQAQFIPEINAAGEAIKPTLWQRVKTTFGQPMLDRFIESYVTPEGLPQLFSYRQTYREKIKGEPSEKTLALHERMRRFWSRVHRAEFQSLTRVEIEMADKDNPARRVVSTMELTGLQWKLVALRVIAVKDVPGSDAAAGDKETQALRLN